MFLLYLRAFALSILTLTGSVLYTAEPNPQIATKLQRIENYKGVMERVKNAQKNPTTVGVSLLPYEMETVRWENNQWLQLDKNSGRWVPVRKGWDPSIALQDEINRLEQEVAQLQQPVATPGIFQPKKEPYAEQKRDPEMLWRETAGGLVAVGTWSEVVSRHELRRFELLQWNSDLNQLDKLKWDPSRGRWENSKFFSNQNGFRPTAKQLPVKVPFAQVQVKPPQQQKPLVQQRQKKGEIPFCPMIGQGLVQPQTQQKPAEYRYEVQQPQPVQQLRPFPQVPAIVQVRPQQPPQLLYQVPSQQPQPVQQWHPFPQAPAIVQVRPQQPPQLYQAPSQQPQPAQQWREWRDPQTGKVYMQDYKTQQWFYQDPSTKEWSYQDPATNQWHPYKIEKQQPQQRAQQPLSYPQTQGMYYPQAPVAQPQQAIQQGIVNLPALKNRWDTLRYVARQRGFHAQEQRDFENLRTIAEAQGWPRIEIIHPRLQEIPTGFQPFAGGQQAQQPPPQYQVPYPPTQGRYY